MVYFLLQDTALALWIPCTFLSGFEAGLSVWCFVIGLGLRGLAPCMRKYMKKQVGVWVDESCHIDPRLKFNCVLICITWCHVSVSNEAKGETTKLHIQFSSSLKKYLTSLHTTSAWLYHTQTLMPDWADRTSGSLGHLDWKGVAPPALTILNCYWI